MMGNQRASWIIGVVSAVLTVGCASSPSQRTPVPAGAAYSAPRSHVVSTSLKYVGAPYEWGGTSPAGFDCSGFIQFVYARAGVSLPHGVVKQYRLGSAVSRDELEPGDLVFFDRLRHAGIYIGDMRFVHATKPGDVVTISRLDDEWFRRRWIGARRLL
jgi:cell wall-associated NlpC family hydrolase